MIWTFLLQLILALAAIGLLRMQRVRDRLVAAAALAGRITVHTANALFDYVLACLIGVAIISAGFLIGLLARAAHLPEFGNFVITGSFLVTAVALGIITLALTAITNAVANMVFRARQTLAKANPAAKEKPGLGDLFVKLREQFPEQKGLLDIIESAGKGWLVSLFDTTGIRSILALPHNVVFDTIEAVTGAVSKMLKFVTAAVLWIAIAGFAALYLPDSANAFWVVAIPYGLLILLGIGAYKGDEWVEKYKLPDLWWGGYRVVRLGVRFAIAAVVFTAIYTTIDPPRTFSHWVVGLQNQFRVNEEQSAKDYFGTRFDQNIQKVIESGTGYRVEEHLFGDEQIPVAVRLNELLWKTEAPHQRIGLIYYAEYQRQLPDRTMSPDPDNTVWFPESKVAAAGQVETRQMTLPVNTVFYPDNNGRPSNRKMYLHKPHAAEVTSNLVYQDGVPFYFARLYNGTQTYQVWVKI